MAVKAGSGAVTVKARERAREARLAAYADQRAHEEAVEEAVAAFFVAAEERDRLTVLVAEQEQAMGAAVSELRGIKEPVERIAAMLGLEAGQVRALQKNAASGTSGKATRAEDDAAGTKSDSVGLTRAS